MAVYPLDADYASRLDASNRENRNNDRLVSHIYAAAEHANPNPHHA